jgi:hypothetical protein
MRPWRLCWGVAPPCCCHLPSSPDTISHATSWGLRLSFSKSCLRLHGPFVFCCQGETFPAGIRNDLDSKRSPGTKYPAIDAFAVTKIDDSAESSGLRKLLRRAGVPLALVLVVAAVVGGSVGLVSAYEPASISYQLDGPPWLMNLGSGRLAVLYTNAGFKDGIDQSAVLYGVVDADGRWVSSPVRITIPSRPTPPGWMAPAGVVGRIDDRMIVHVGWALWDPENDNLSFHYIQLDTTGSVRVRTGPIASFSATEIYVPMRMGIHVTSDEVRVAFTNGTYTPSTYTVSTLDMAGRVKSAPYPAPDLDNASYFPSRRFPPGVTGTTNDPLDSDASVVSDSTNTYYLWINGRQWFEGRRYRSERDLQFHREGASGNLSRVLYSTEDSWWLNQPTVLPSFVSLFAAIPGTAILVWQRSRTRPSKRS